MASLWRTIRLRPLVLWWALMSVVSLAVAIPALEAANYPWDRPHIIGAVNAVVGAATLWCVATTVFGLWRMRRTGRTGGLVFWLAALLAGVVGGGFALCVLLAAVVVSGDASLSEMIEIVARGEARTLFAAAGAIGGAVGLLFGLLWRIPLKMSRRADQ